VEVAVAVVAVEVAAAIVVAVTDSNKIDTGILKGSPGRYPRRAFCVFVGNKKTPTASQSAEFSCFHRKLYLYKGNKGKGFVKSVVHLFTNE